MITATIVLYKENEEILKRINDKPAMYSNVYSPEDELEVFI